VAPQLASGETTVGTSVTMEHRRASPVGSSLVIEAELTEVDGPRLAFSFIAREEHPRIAREEHPRAQAPGPEVPVTEAPGAQAPGAQAPGADAPGGDERVVGAGTIERVVVSRERFLARAAAHHPGPR
jgi:predicted thioesterase